MSMFFCQRCDQIRDADDGCEELGGNLICHGCYDEFMAEAEDAAGEPPTSAPKHEWPDWLRQVAADVDSLKGDHNV